METWLADMAEKGFFLYDLGATFARFTKSAPNKARYRLEPAEKDAEYPGFERRQLCEEMGWRYVATIWKICHIFMTEDAGAPELHTDPLVQSYTVEKLTRRLVAWAAVSIALLAVIAGIIVSSVVRGTFVRNLILNSNPLSLLIFPFGVLGVCRPVAYACAVTKQRKRLRSGLPLEHRRATGMAKR
jgi:hypothetical protein